MKCVSFYCNIAHELKYTGMQPERISVDYMIKFLQPTSYRFSLRAPWVARQIQYMQSISAYTLLSESRATVATASHILATSSGKVAANRGTYTAS
jgi:hypothetical protein